MSTSNNNGPAFPTTNENYQGRYSGDGMSLRDYFAAAALSHSYTQDEGKPGRIAEWAYQIADAMLKAREVQP